MTGGGDRPPAPAAPPGLAEIFKRLDAYDGAQPFGARVAAGLLGVQARTVTGWATSRRLSGLLLARNRGWEFTVVDLKEFLAKRYHPAANR